MANDNTGYKPLLQRMMPGSSLYNNEKAPNPKYNSPLSGIMDKMSSAWQDGQDNIYTGPGDMGSGGAARQFARTFNPQDTDDVKKMQSMLGVKTDGILGPKTLGALQKLQGVSPQEAPEDYSGSSEESQWADEEGYGGDFGDSGYDSYGPPAEAPMMGPEARGPKMPGVKGWLQRIMPGGQSGYGDPNAPNSPQEISDFNYQGGNESSEPRLNRQETEFAGDDGVSEELEYGVSDEYDNPYGYSEELEYGVSEEPEYGVSDEYDDPYGYSEEEDEYGVSEEGGINPNPNQFGRGQGFQMPKSRASRILDQYNRSKRFTNKY